MRIQTINLQWFRGAGDTASLSPIGKSIVVYGENGAGKSSFVDAIEYLIRKGKIGHLELEYSGRNQEIGVINTHKPNKSDTEIRNELPRRKRTGYQFESTILFRPKGRGIKPKLIKFDNLPEEHHMTINVNGKCTSNGTESIAIDTWKYQSTVLRQNEVSAFVHNTKGEKYSALLPLLGLAPMENAAENIRQLGKCVEKISNLCEKKSAHQEIHRNRQKVLKDMTDEEIHEMIEEFHKQYCPEDKETVKPLSRCEKIEAAINDQVSKLSEENKKYYNIENAGKIALADNIAEVRAADAKLASDMEKHITEKMNYPAASGRGINLNPLFCFAPRGGELNPS